MGSRPIAYSYRVERCDRNRNASRNNGRGDPAHCADGQRPWAMHAADGGERSIARRAGEGAVANWMPAPCSRHQSYQYLMVLVHVQYWYWVSARRGTAGRGDFLLRAGRELVLAEDVATSVQNECVAHVSWFPVHCEASDLVWSEQLSQGKGRGCNGSIPKHTCTLRHRHPNDR